ncbi:MAG: hypothetical protein NXH70_16285 [Hyphomonas sp.]|nr:hypothetical protein [Hyphomonas sp.]
MKCHRKLSVALTALGLTGLLAACGGGGGEALEGAYYPQFGPGANRLGMALTDQSWTFSADGTVVTTSESGARPWTYKVRGKKVELSGASDRNAGEKRVLTIGDNGCIWDGPANRSDKIAFCL